MTLPARPRTLAAPPPPAALPRATIVALPVPAAPDRVQVKLDGDAQPVWARVVDGAGITPALGARVRLELVGRDLTVIRGA